MTKKAYFILVLAAIILLLAVYPLDSSGQTGSRLVHYSVEDGLPQNRVSGMLEDSRGYIWIATQNGAARFDGYEFVPYLNGSSTTYRVRDSRIARIAEDRWGCIWFITQTGDVHRLEPALDSLIDVGALLAVNERPFAPSRIKVQSSGQLWLIEEGNGCAVIRDADLSRRRYCVDNGGLKGDVISYIHEDRESNTWILTDNGLTLIRKGMEDPAFFFEGNSNTRQAFYAALEWEDKIWFGSDRGRIWQYCKKEDKFELIETRIPSSIIHLIHGKEGQAVIGTQHHGVLLHDLAGGHTEHYHSGNSGLADDRILAVFYDPYDNIWLHIPVPGMARLDPESKMITQHGPGQPDPNAYANAGAIFRIDPENRVWIRPRDGVFSFYDPQSKELIPFHQTAFSPSSDYGSTIYQAFFDRRGNLWLSPTGKGLDKITFPGNEFGVRKITEGGVAQNNDVRALLEDRSGNLWVSTKEGKIHLFGPSETYLGYICSDGTIGDGTPLRGIAYSLFQTAAGEIWVGTKGNGLYGLIPQGDRYGILHYENDPDDLYSLNNNNIYTIQNDSSGRLWIGTWGGGLNLLDRTANGKVRFIHHHNHLKNYPIDQASKIRHISREKNGKIYLGSSTGLLVFDAGKRAPDQIEFRHYPQGAPPGESVTNGDIHHVCHAATGTYLATVGGGMNRITEWNEDGFPMRFEAYTRKEGLYSDVIVSILESPDSLLWIVSEDNITLFNPEAGTFRKFSESHELVRNALFSEGSALVTTRQKIILGYSQGLLSFHPKQIDVGSFVPPLVFTHFRVSNEEVPVGPRGWLPQHIDYQEQITLSHRDKVFSIGFAALDFRAPENIRYAYLLEGFDKDWLYAEKQRTASYMNLPRGEYRLRVRSTNADGTWVENERSIAIRRPPSFWESGWGYGFYILLIGILFLVTTYVLHTIFRLKNQVRLESQLAEMKLRFFTDISHEIRTPLTLITAPVDYLIHDAKTPDPIRNQLGLVAQNAERMLRMVNQILDFRKAQNGRLKIEQFPAGEFLQAVCHHFDDMAAQQQIDFTFCDSTHGALLWADKDGVEKILFNLLSNAFKHTPSGKSIRVKLDCSGETFCLQVCDQGKGIAPEKQRLIFERFFTVKSHDQVPGSGIGLSLVHELVGKHGGSVEVESAPGRGTVFTVFFHRGYEHYGKETDWIVSPSLNLTEKGTPCKISDSIETEVTETEEEEIHNRKPSVLVVEDDPDLRAFLLSILAPDYRVLTAENGKAGYNMAVKYIPDFVVSDVMMPEMDGVILLKELKSNLNTSHIPVVLLSAKGSIENRLEGLGYGADDYIVKPFSVPYFRARILNLLNQRKHLQSIFCHSLLPSYGKYEQIRNTNIATLDQNFLDHIVAQIEQHLDDSEYSVEDLVKTTGISRTAFFKKIKNLTGMAPIELIRDIRIQHAAKLLKTRQLMIKEVSYMVGFTDLKYFTRCFKMRYNMTPAQYKASGESIPKQS